MTPDQLHTLTVYIAWGVAWFLAGLVATYVWQERQQR